MAEVAPGSRLRTERFEGLRDYLLAQPSPFTVWVQAVDEIRGLIGARTEDATLAPCPVLHAAGFSDREAHYKMHGYIADRPEALSGSRPKAIVVCPANEVAAARAADDVVFVGVNCRTPGGSLDQAIKLRFGGSSA